MDFDNIIKKNIAYLLVVFIALATIIPDALKVFLYFIIIFCLLIDVKAFRTLNLNKFHYLLILLYVLFNAIISYKSSGRMVHGIFQYIFFPMVLYFSINYFKGFNIKNALRLLVFFSIITSVIAIYEGISGDYIILKYFPNLQGDAVYDYDTDYGEKHRALSVIGSPLALGIMCAIYSMISYHIWIKRSRIIYLIFFTINLLGMIAANSRGSQISFLISFVLYNIIVYRANDTNARLKEKIKKIIVIICCLIIIAGIGDSSYIVDRLISVTDITGEEGDMSNAIRFLIWEHAITIYSSNIHNVLFGIGVGATGNASTAEFITESGLLKRLVEGGIIMVGLYYSYLISILLMIKKKMRYMQYGIKLNMCLAMSIFFIVQIEDLILQITEATNISMIMWLGLGYCASVIENRDKLKSNE